MEKPIKQIALMVTNKRQMNVMKSLGVEAPKKGIYAQRNKDELCWHDLSDKDFLETIGYVIVIPA